MANFWGPSQGTKIFNKSGTAANGTTNYVNESNPSQLTQIPANLPDLARTIWIAAATWGAASVSVQTSPDSVNWFTLPDATGATTFNANTVFNLWARGNLYFRTVVTGADSTTNGLTVTVTSGI